MRISDWSSDVCSSDLTAHGTEIRVGRNVFVNQNCTFYDLGGLDIADDVLIGPNVSLITTGHPLEPSQRRAVTIGKPIIIERNVWIATGATIIGGVTIGENSVVAAGSDRKSTRLNSSH